MSSTGTFYQYKMVGVILFIGLIAMLLLGYYILYIRKRLVNRWNLEQVLEINRQIFAASLIQVPETEEALQREEDTRKLFLNVLLTKVSML